MSRKASKTHDDCRSLLCFGCAKSSCSKRLGPSDKSLVELFFDQAFNWSDPKYPLGICGPCQKALKATNFSNPESVTKLTDSWKSMPWLSDEHFAVPSSPLRSSGKCPCKICEAAKSQAPTKGFKHFKKSNPFGSKESKAGRPPKAASGLLCKDCLAEVKAGEEHKCSPANRRSSLLKLAEADPQGSQMIAAKVVKDLPGSPGKGTKRLVQAHGGKPLPVLPGGSAPVRSNSKKVSARNVLAIQARTDLSARKRRQVVSDVNRYHKMGSVSGRKVFRSNVESDISEMKRIFSTHFETTEVTINGEKTILAHVKSSDQFEKYLLKCKGIDHGNILNRISMDSGGDFLKMSMNIIDMFEATDPERLANSKRLDPVKVGSPGALDSGIKGLFILCIGQKVNETPEAINTFFELTSLKDIQYKLASDFKVGNICAGLMASNAMCPCIYCNQLRKNFHKKGDDRTVGNIREMFLEFEKANGVTPRNAKAMFDSVCREPILPGCDPTEKILHCIPPPELHLMEGITNHVLTKIRRELPEFKEFLHKLNLDREKYEMYTTKCNFEGNDCVTILNHIDDFIASTTCGVGTLPGLLVQPHLHFLRAFSKVVSSCFGFNLEPDYGEKIDLAKEAFNSLVKATAGLMPRRRQVRYFYKVHVALLHVKDFVKDFGPLGPYSEQAGETAHSWWSKLWVNYRSLPMTQADRLFWCLVEWNFRRLSLILGTTSDDED